MTYLKGFTKSQLENQLAYDPVSGVLRRKHGPRKGHVAGAKNSGGYVQIRVNGILVLAHQIAWFLVYGEIPANDIDHENRVRSDNAIKNLRSTTRHGNVGNSCIRK